MPNAFGRNHAIVETTRIPAKLSREEYAEVGRLLVSKFYWPKILLTNWYGLVLLLALIWATIAEFLNKDSSHLTGLALVWLVVFGIVGWAFYSTKRSTAREYKTLTETLPDFVTIASDGVHFDGPSGANAFSPWSHYKGWREGKKVVLLSRSLGGGTIILPVGDLLPAERERVRRLLMQYLSDPT